MFLIFQPMKKTEWAILYGPSVSFQDNYRISIYSYEHKTLQKNRHPEVFTVFTVKVLARLLTARLRNEDDSLRFFLKNQIWKNL